ncbi:MAG: acyl--CoA ligase, partial [Eggerthellaceae bacterium]|nr:acyl--CoA ligase [Eggerthellaceae bacterium]
MATEQVDTMSLEEAVARYDKLWRAAYDEEVGRTFTQTHQTIRECMDAWMQTELADEPLIYFEDRVITRREANEQANRLANALFEVGAVKGRRVSIIMANRPEIVETFMACYKGGFIAAPFNERCTSREIQGAIRTAGSSTVIIEYAQFEKIFAPVEEGDCPCVHRIIVLDWPAERPLPEHVPVPVYDYADLVSGANPEEPAVEILPDDEALLLYTGGTTGVPKGCCQTQRRMTFELQAMHHWAHHVLKHPDPRTLICMPMTHIMGINYGINWQMINGGSTIIVDGHKAHHIIDAFNRFEPTMWAALPTLIHSISFDPELSATTYRNLDFVIFGGSFIAKETLHNMIAKTDASFIESYGMTESFGFVTANPAKSMGKVGSIGLPISSTDVLIVDTEDGTKALPPNHYGEIIFRGPEVIDEYWNNPEETAKAIRNGWMYSGDIG